MIQSGGFLGRLLGPLSKTGLPLMKNVIKKLAKSVFMPLGLTAAAAADAGIHKQISGSGDRPSSSASHNYTILIISNDEMKDINKIVKSLEDSSQELVKQFKTKLKKKTEGFLSASLGTLGAILLGNILAGKGINRAGEGIVRAGYGNKKGQETRKKRQDHKNEMDL